MPESIKMSMEKIKKLEQSASWFSSTACVDPDLILPADEETEAFLEDWREYQKAVRKFQKKYDWIND